MTEQLNEESFKKELNSLNLLHLIYKWKLIGSGNVVADYSEKNGRKFTHKKLNKKFEL